jgi:hypothetical protein
MRFFLSFILIFLVADPLWSYEVDNFTGRYKPLKDSQGFLDKAVNTAMKEALEKDFIKANDYIRNRRKYSATKPTPCDPQWLRGAVSGALTSGWVVGKLESLATESKEIDKSEPQDENIYMYRSGKDKAKGFVLSLMGLGPSINVNGYFIGVDKLGHFFDQGNDYYSIYRKEVPSEAAVHRALSYGASLEDDIYGKATTGVKSYGDLAANYGGFLFWSQLTEGAHPYFVCENDKWKQVREFQWGDYVTSAWDEAINCSEYTGETFQKAVATRAKELEEVDAKLGKSHRYKCPVSPNECVKLRKSYGHNASMILGPECMSALGSSDELPSSAQKAQAPGQPANNSNQGIPYGGVQ